MNTLYRYLLTQIILTTLWAMVVLTSVIVLGNVLKRLFDLLVNYDIPADSLFTMLMLLVPQALTFTVPWGFLIAILLVFGRMSADLELQAVHTAGVGLIPFIAPVVLLSLMLSLLCLFNNLWLAPQSMARFKSMALELARQNPTAFLRAQEPITQFKGMRLYLERKHGTEIEGVYIWQLGPSYIPVSSLRARRGILRADLEREELTIDLFDVRQEQAGRDPTSIKDIRPGASAAALPLTISLRDLLDRGSLNTNISLLPVNEVTKRLFAPTGDIRDYITLLTELQRRLAFSFAPFTFVLMGIPLGIVAQRKETSSGLVISMAVVIAYYLMVAFAMALKDSVTAYPDLIVWLPNVVFQALGFFLLWKVNRRPM